MDYRDLQENYREGKLGRRDFILGALLLGVSAGAIVRSGTSMAQSTGTLTLAVASLDGGLIYPPLGGSDILRGALGPMFDTLVREVPAEGRPMGVAESFELADDNVTWTFHIRRGVKFHSGEELTAHDVKFSLDQFAREDARLPYLRDWQKSVEVVDDYTVRVVTNGVQPFYKTRIGWGGTTALMMSKKYYEEVGEEHAARNPIGTGPFKFVREVLGDSIEYEAVTEHFRHVPNFQTLRLLQVPDAGTRVNLLKSGEIDATSIGFEAAKEVEAAGLRTIAIGQANISLMFNGAYDPRAMGMPITDIRVRRALSLAINRDEIASTYLEGRAGRLMPPMGGPDSAAALDVDYWAAKAAETYRYNLDEARALLNEANYGNGFTLKMFSYATPDAAYLPQLASVIQGYWQALGVTTEIVPIDLGVFRPMVSTSADSPYPADPAVVGAVNLNVAPPNMPLGLVVYFGNGAWNLVQEGEPEVIRAVQAAVAEPNEKARVELTARALQLVIDTHTMEMIAAVPSLVGLGPNVDVDPALLAGNRVDTIVQYADLATPRM